LRGSGDVWAAASKLALVAALLALALIGVRQMPLRADGVAAKGYGAPPKGYGPTPTGLQPRYPQGYACSRLTSLYASWKDIDGSDRDEPHSGVDGGRFGDPIFAPGPGVVRAVWPADWGWGPEGALLIKHSAEDLNLDEGVPQYYSAFYHLSMDEVKNYEVGQRIERGQLLAHVVRPGGKRFYLPEVHWEVYEVGNDNATRWHENQREYAYWTNRTAKLIDPLYLMTREPGTLDGTGVLIEPLDPERDYVGYRGFTYILPCLPREGRKGARNSRKLG
jgi:murein DD-endopeptidase MepM/ murein hydrolase activator NlpD